MLRPAWCRPAPSPWSPAGRRRCSRREARMRRSRSCASISLAIGFMESAVRWPLCVDAARGCNPPRRSVALPMQFDPPLTPGILVRRYKRFLADVTIDGPGRDRPLRQSRLDAGSRPAGLAGSGFRSATIRHASCALSWELVEVGWRHAGGHQYRLCQPAGGGGHSRRQDPGLAGYPARAPRGCLWRGFAGGFPADRPGPPALLCRGEERHAETGRDGGVSRRGHGPGNPPSARTCGHAPGRRPGGDAVPGPAR